MQPIRKIESFSGHYRFLSNFWPCRVTYAGQSYPSVEHAYQAAKFPVEKRLRFCNPALKPGKAKAMGRGAGGPNWHKRSLSIMLDLLRQKFREPELHNKLLCTVGAELIEGNDWGDTFFGVCKGTGENWLGRLLMAVRDEIAAEEPRCRNKH